MEKSIIDTSGVVVNVVCLADGAEWTPPEGCTIGPDGGYIGDQWNGSQYIRPPQPDPGPAVPRRVTPSAESEPDPRVSSLQDENAALKSRQSEIENLMLAMAKQMEAMKVVTDAVQATAAKVEGP